MYRQDGLRGRLAVRAAHQRGEQIALTVGVRPQRHRGLLVAGKDIVGPFGLRCRHGTYPNCEQGGGVVLATLANKSVSGGIT
ncbi:hypothetical protein GCM10010533_43120 [Mycolicibacterium pallens]